MLGLFKRRRSAAVATGQGILTAADLDDFVQETDRRGPLGGADVSAYWSGLSYKSAVHVDDELDPFDEKYVSAQIAIYREISGRDIDQKNNELTQFNIEEHVTAVNPYGKEPAHVIGMHFSRLSRALLQSGLDRGQNILDLGCGWGLSSELFAYSGLRVTAVDINPQFVELVQRRAADRGLAITAVEGTFEDIPSGSFDAVAYYECLHHAIRPWAALSAARDVLKPGGKLLIAGEPLNYMWKHWGIRNDLLSIYCIRKFGWFESGWSPSFLEACIQKCGFEVRYCADEGGIIGWVIVAEKVQQG